MSNKMSFGYLFDFRNPPQWRRPWSELYAEILDFIPYTESLGFEAAWVPEHHNSEDGYIPSPLIALAAIAARTKKIKLGTAVALAPLYQPTRFAEDCAVLDAIAGGRLELTLAIGYRKKEADGFGVDFTKRGAITDEFLEIVTRLWKGEAVTFEGKHFKVNNPGIMPRPERGKIPLYLGGFTDKALERTVKYADGYFGNIDGANLYCEKLKAQGKDPAKARIRLLDLTVVVTNDPEKALDELAPYFLHVNNTYGAWAMEDSKATGFSEDISYKPTTLEAFKASGALHCMTPDKAIDMFKKIQAKSPVEHFMLMVPPGIAPKKFAPYAELFAKEVLPAFR